MAECVEMGHAAVDVELLHVAAEPGIAARVVGGKGLEPDLVERDAVRFPVRLRLGRFRDERDPALERDHGAGLRQRHRLLALLGRHQIQGAELIVFAPPARVRQLRHPAIGLRLCHGSVVRRGRRRLLSVPRHHGADKNGRQNNSDSRPSM
jgi:hypothetical protein